MSHHEATGNHEHRTGFPPCRVCTATIDPEHKGASFGICNNCAYKILILVLIVMVSISYIAWFGIF